MSYSKLLLKIKDYARNKKLDTEASKGKQAVDVGSVDGPVQSGGTKEESNGQNYQNLLVDVGSVDSIFLVSNEIHVVPIHVFLPKEEN